MKADPAKAQWADELLTVWFDDLGPDAWFDRDDGVDAMLSRRFGPVLSEQARQPARAFLDHPDTARAAILLFDQVPRNIFRDDPRAFAYDDKACAITKGLIAQGWLSGLPEPEAQFALMPLMHSERLADQDRSVALFAKHAPVALDFARSHREAIARFGRFPHRNELLGRETTPEEADAIAEGLSW